MRGFLNVSYAVARVLCIAVAGDDVPAGQP